MTTTPHALQSQLDRLMADAQTLQSALQQKVDQHRQLANEIEQHKGALAYNGMLVEATRKQLTELAAAAEKPATPPSV